VAEFYLEGIRRVEDEWAAAAAGNGEVARRLEELCRYLAEPESARDRTDLQEETWSVFFPEAAGIVGHEAARVAALREERRVRITALNPDPIREPAREILFTSNALLTLPPVSRSLDELPLGPRLRAELHVARAEPQRYWYDHPIQMGVDLDRNEVVYGLRGLAETLAHERARGTVTGDARLTCVLSVSVTHERLQGIAGAYVEEELRRAGGLQGLDVHAFTEADTRRLLNTILVPAAVRFLGLEEAEARELLAMFGVDGEYGRHYSFLKAISAFWSVLVDPAVRATFKIDLDQVFPQKQLVSEAGASALEHLRTPLWGAVGTDGSNRTVELGMIAGALVNEREIHRSLYTPDVPFPDRDLSLDEHVFFSLLPQALSTEAEMMTRYEPGALDGARSCIQRIHVTGGTNGILVESLRQHRPFTPSFFGRAEDQAYILSAIGRREPRLAYAHKDGLIMRHDKEAFASDSIRAAHVGKLVGDYVRVLYFSAYARVLSDDWEALKGQVDPFTGCFISRIPATVVYLRFALKALALQESGRGPEAKEFVTGGAERLSKAFEFVDEDAGLLRRAYEKERRGWDLYYDVLDALEEALARGDPRAKELRQRAVSLVRECSVPTGEGRG
jgi:hypothetical protein